MKRICSTEIRFDGHYPDQEGEQMPPERCHAKPRLSLKLTTMFPTLGRHNEL
jgi:hypothetical protein